MLSEHIIVIYNPEHAEKKISNTGGHTEKSWRPFLQIEARIAVQQISICKRLENILKRTELELN